MVIYSSNKSEWWYQKASRTQHPCSSKKNFWKLLNSRTAHSYITVVLLKASLSIHKFDIIWLLETYLDPSVPSHEVNLEIQGYELVQSDHPSQHKRGDVWIYLRNPLQLKILNIHYLQEIVSSELQVGSKEIPFNWKY